MAKPRPAHETPLDHPVRVRDTSGASLKIVLGRIVRSGAPQELQARLRELEEYLSHVEDTIILTQDQGHGLTDAMVEKERLLFEAYDALAQGLKGVAVGLLQRVLGPEKAPGQVSEKEVATRPGSCSGTSPWESTER
ncbi:MAG: hypothetical protein HYU29_04955 [Chloroflexi bacterium]|nr:hypothetical protein [Chloroflexota bacterium]